MCGFAGYKSLGDKQVDGSLLEAISHTLEHRGPDDSGTWLSPDKKLALVARRLSILDLSKAGAQPMMDSDQTMVISFNGEIYNHRAIRAELEHLGHRFSSGCDTQVFLYAFKQWGIECLKRLNGMFACAIYDLSTDSLYLVRDRMGIKPLYFSLQANMLSFASEIKALWQLPWMVKRLSPRGVYHYLTYLATPAPMTIFEELYKLPAGYYAKLDSKNEISFHQWYDQLDVQSTFDSSKKESSYAKDIMHLLQSSVHDRLVADVPVGALLSGGLDSSLLVALMAQKQKEIETFNVYFEDDPQDERKWARKVAKKFGANHHELILSQEDAFSFFNKMVYHQDEPLGDSVCIPLYFVSKMARDAGVKVVLSGEGADELFCGYPMYVDYLKLNRYWNSTQHYAPQAAKKGLYYAAKPLYGNLNRQDLIKCWADGRPLFWGGVRLFSELWKKDLFIGDHAHEPDSIIEKIVPGFSQMHDSYQVIDYYRTKFYKKLPDADFYSLMTYIELKHRLPELILTRTDKMTMAASIEARVPFLDHKLVEYMLGVPLKYKYGKGQTKYILKKVAEQLLPPEIIYRKKVGFSSSVTRWYAGKTLFTHHLQDMLHSNNLALHDLIDKDQVSALLNANQTTKANYASQLWALQNLYGIETA